MSMFKFTDEQRTKILTNIDENHSVRMDDLYEYILEVGYKHHVAQGLDYAFIDIFRKDEQDVIFMLMAPTVSAEHGHFSITIMDHINLPIKYYGHGPEELLEQVRGKI